MVILERRRRKPEINIIPLVDVLIVLIFFFLFSMQFRNMNTLNITLPKIETAGESKLDEQVEIAVDENGEMYLNGKSMNELELLGALRAIASVNREVPVVLVADEESYLRHVTFIMDSCRKVGLEKVRIQSR